MIYIKNTNTEPYFNLAAEEYVLNEFDDAVFMLWRNDKSVILGKNQNAYSEININYVNENNIKVVRRLTGGGCVFHDLGNINFSFICDAEKNKILNFRYFMEPVILALKELGIDADFTGRNDICAGEYKISGNAQCVYTVKKDNIQRERILHHGTLLFNADMGYLVNALNVNREKIESKGIKSISSRVANIYNLLPDENKMNAKDFFNFLEKFIMEKNNCRYYEFNDYDIKKIQDSADNKYSIKDFIYGSIRDYSFKNKKHFTFGTVEIRFNVAYSIINDISIKGDFFGEKDIAELERIFTGTRHDKISVENKLNSFNISDYIYNMKNKDFSEIFF